MDGRELGNSRNLLQSEFPPRPGWGGSVPRLRRERSPQHRTSAAHCHSSHKEDGYLTSGRHTNVGVQSLATTCGYRGIAGLGAAMLLALLLLPLGLALGQECDSEGAFPDPDQCDKYWECRGGNLTSHLCPDGLVYDLTTSVASFQVNVDYP